MASYENEEWANNERDSCETIHDELPANDKRSTLAQLVSYSNTSWAGGIYGAPR